jgi:NADP-dependent 3-hydroxy acid dehydrogenase YdfG
MSMQIMNLESRIAVVVGSTSGIGRAIALGLADAGVDVVASSRRSDAVADTCAQIEQRRRRTLAFTSDVCNATSLSGLSSAVIERFGRVDSRWLPTRQANQPSVD